MSLVIFALFACAAATTLPGTPATGTSGVENTVEITEQVWDDAASCWLTRVLVRPESAWPERCDETIDTGAAFAYDLVSDADGNCARLPNGCEHTDDFFAACAEVDGCCDEAKLASPYCG